ncbi:hypothetical protein [Parvularcula dongshanensis]|uniref:Uncharacterized protein n=1 Tax=Parvularcula dongshanensis TaxID=1173995 RepID=A0A840I0L9_9PROT|nr:hypothetical protein [Parvularcula dongshanensis]MBB4657823.1 hypothetical protein [Parvularcula dongshanensis]
MRHVHFSGPNASALIGAAGATIASFALRGWRCTVAAGGAKKEALAALGAEPEASGEADLFVAHEAERPRERPCLFWGGAAPLILRVHEGLDAKVAALGAQRGFALGEGEARAVILAALTLGQGTGAEGFAPGEGAEDRLPALLAADR